MHGEFWYQAFVYLCAAVITVPIAQRTGLGSVLGYLLAGVAIGPAGLALVGTEESEDVLHFAEFGVVMMLFLVGLELEPAKLWRLRRPVLGLGGLQVVVTSAAIASIAVFLLGQAPRSGIALGMIAALSSTAIVLQSLAEKGQLGTTPGQSAFAVLLFQDIAVIPMLAMMPVLADPSLVAALAETHDVVGDHGSGAHAAPHHSDVAHSNLGALVRAGWTLATVAGVVVGGRFLSVPAFRFIAAARLPELFTAAALLLVVGISLAMQSVGLSPALGTFVAGVVLANNEYRHELEADIEPFKGLLLGLFFLSVGAGIDFELIAAEPATIGGLVTTLVLTKLVVLAALGRIFGMRTRENMLFTFALAQGGEFAFVLGTFATSNGVLDDRTCDVLIAVIAVSMATAPLLLLAEERILRPFFAAREARDPEIERRRREAADALEAADEQPVIIAGFGRFGIAVARLLKTQGVGVTVLDLDPAQIAMLAEFGFESFYGDASRVDLLESAGAAQARLLIIAIDDPERAVEIARVARKHFPDLEILARVRGRREAYEMMGAGVEHVYRETLGTSIDLGVDALRLLGFHAHRAWRLGRMFHAHDEAGVRDLAAHWDDRKTYVSLARERSAEVGRLLGQDRAGLGSGLEDDAWEPPTSAVTPPESTRTEEGSERDVSPE